jgi:deoxyribose-phosphate aldolase
VQSVVQAAINKAHVKVILEMCYLDQREKIIGCLLCKEAGADFVKTSTGFGPGGATLADVTLMRRVVGPGMGVKAAGGIRTLQDARQMIAAGASRLGASAGIAILKEAGAA